METDEIKNKEDYENTWIEAANLSETDPPPNSPNGHRLALLSLRVRKYEESHLNDIIVRDHSEISVGPRASVPGNTFYCGTAQDICHENGNGRCLLYSTTLRKSKRVLLLKNGWGWLWIKCEKCINLAIGQM